MGDDHLIGGQAVVKGQSGSVFDALSDGILVQVALVVFETEGLESPLAVGRFVDRRSGEADEGGPGQTGHQVVAQVAPGGAMGLVDQHVDVFPGVDVRRQVPELMDHGHDDPPVVVLQQSFQFRNGVGMGHILQTDGRQIFEHLVFQFVAVDHQQDGGLVGLRRLKEQFGGLDHSIGLAAPLGVPDQASGPLSLQGTMDDLTHGNRLVLA